MKTKQELIDYLWADTLLGDEEFHQLWLLDILAAWQYIKKDFLAGWEVTNSAYHRDVVKIYEHLTIGEVAAIVKHLKSGG